MSDLCPECGIDGVEADALMRAADAPAEYFHICPDTEGMAGPFATLEEAQADALEYLHDYRFQVPECRIVKVVSKSSTKVSYDTTWSKQ